MDDPRTLPCLHSFCLACLESQKAFASSELRCLLCRAPFTPPSPGGLADFECNAFIDSLVKSPPASVENVNRVVKCTMCELEDAAFYCVDCAENYCPSCSKTHRRVKVSSAHQQIPLEEALSGNSRAHKIPHCHRHPNLEITTFCVVCDIAVCAVCTLEQHSGHSFCPLSQVTDSLQTQTAAFVITLSTREKESRQAIDLMDQAINSIEEHHAIAVKEVASLRTELSRLVDARIDALLGEVEDRYARLRNVTVREKAEGELATVAFREFCSFTEGLLVHGTPLEIAATYAVVNARALTLNTTRIPPRPSFSPKFAVSPANLGDIKRAIDGAGTLEWSEGDSGIFWAQPAEKKWTRVRPEDLCEQLLIREQGSTADRFLWERLGEIMGKISSGFDLARRAKKVVAVRSVRMRQRLEDRRLSMALETRGPDSWWEKEDRVHRQRFVGYLQSLAVAFEENAYVGVAVVPMIHVNKESHIQAFLSSGNPRDLPEADAFYGKGTYFTRDADYAVLRGRVLLLSAVLVGNPYPVTEDPQGKASFSGKACMPRYHSHYTVGNLTPSSLFFFLSVL